MKTFRILPFSLFSMALLSCLLSASVAYPQSNRMINRVQPPRNTIQYKKEADRVHLEALTKLLGLSQEQVAQFQKENASVLKKELKLSNQLSKERKRWDDAQKKNAEAKQKLSNDYDTAIRKILTAEQYAAYQKWRNDYNLPISITPESCDSLPVDSIIPGTGPVVKGPDPILLIQ